MKRLADPFRRGSTLLERKWLAGCLAVIVLLLVALVIGVLVLQA